MSTESMKNHSNSWLQMYVDAVTERDPYKRLALVRELRTIPRHDESEELMELMLERRPARKEVRRSSQIKRKRSR